MLSRPGVRFALGLIALCGWAALEPPLHLRAVLEPPLQVYGSDASQARAAWPPLVRKTPDKAPVLTPQQELATIVVPPGYRVELVASEPLVIDPILIDFDADGRMWVVEMPGFMPDTSGTDSRDPINGVAVLEDTNGDGVMDRRTVFADKLVLPRALKVLAGGRVLVGEPPNLWLMTDTDGDLKADTRVLVSNTYGRAEGNIEHNANSLLWALDNTIYTSEHDWHLRWKNGAFETLPTLSRGQWGASQDDAGRVYRNFNDAPLFVDYLAPSYYMRNPNLARTRGLYDPLISREASVVWPIRATRGVNRGYRDQFFRPDDSSITIQAAGTPLIFRGDRLPKALQGQAFITDSATNLVHAYRIVDDGTGRLRAEDFYRKGEFFASSDERCRPVNIASAPDGTLYVVDMYRGVVQDGMFWTDYLRDYIKSRDLELPVKLGRIWRIVHEGQRPSPAPRLSSASSAQLVETLSHSNGWWRDTAQQLLVQRGDKAMAPQLRALAGQAADWRTRLHALWTLDGLDALEPAQVERALSDRSPNLRASAVRLSEPWLPDLDQPLGGLVAKRVDDVSWTVRRQVAASIGRLPEAARIESATTILERYGSDPIVVDATISGLPGSEAAVLERILGHGLRGRVPSSGAQQADAVTMLAATIAKGGDAAAVTAADCAVDGRVRRCVATGCGVERTRHGSHRPRRTRPASAHRRSRGRTCGADQACVRQYRDGAHRQEHRQPDRVARQTRAGRHRAAIHARRAASLRCGSGAVQEPLHRLSSGGRAWAREDGADARGFETRHRRGCRQCRSHSPWRHGGPDRSDAATCVCARRRANRRAADVHPARVGPHRLRGCSGRCERDPRVDANADASLDGDRTAAGTRRTLIFRGASPLGPRTLSRAPLRRRAPFAWLTRYRSFAGAASRVTIWEIRSNSVAALCLDSSGSRGRAHA